MDITEITINGQGGEAWVHWQADVYLKLVYTSPAEYRRISKRVTKPQFRGHQRTENEIDTEALRDYYCREIIKEIKGLTKDGEPFNPTDAELIQIWDGNHDFGIFVVEASRELQHFVQEKKQPNSTT